MEHVLSIDTIYDNDLIDIGNGVAVKYESYPRERGNSYIVCVSLEHFGKEVIGETSFELSSSDDNRLSMLERSNFINKSVNEFIENNLSSIKELKSKLTFGESILMQKIIELTDEVKELHKQVEELSDNQ